MITKEASRRLLGLLLLTGPIFGATIVGFTTPVSANAADDVWPTLLRQDLVRAGRIEWRLREAAGSACPRQVSDAGLVLDDRRAYEKHDWPLLEAKLSIKEQPVVAGVAPDSPADFAGLREGDELLAISGTPSEELIAQRKADTLVVDALLNEIDQAVPGVPLVLDLRREGKLLQVRVVPIAHCAVRLVLFTNRQVEAHSDTRNVAISTGMLAFARTDDELALAVGHEFAHVINGDRRGAPTKVRRGMEDAADMIGLQLMECAGFDRSAGIRLFERLGSRDWLGFLRAQTHRSWKDRTRSLRAQPTTVSCPVTRK